MKSTVLSMLALGAVATAAIGAGPAVAEEPFELTAAQMDAVTGGLEILIHPPDPIAPVIDPDVQAVFNAESLIEVDLGGLLGETVIPPDPIIEIHPPDPVR